jgi:signal transduction histidine kinase
MREVVAGMYLERLVAYLLDIPWPLAVLFLTGLAVLGLQTLVVRARAGRQIRRMQQLLEAMSAAGRSTRTKRMLGTVLETVTGAVAAPAGLVYLLDAPAGNLVLKAKLGIERAKQYARAASEGWPRLTVGESVCVEGWPAAALGLEDVADRKGEVTALIAPVCAQDRLLGAMIVAWPGWRVVDDDAGNLLIGVGEHLGAVVENLEMQEALRAQTATLDEALVELRERDERQGQMVEEIMHDLRNPLGVAQGMVELALDDACLADDSRKALTGAAAGIGRALAWTNDLLDTRAGRVSLNLERVAIYEVVEASVGVARVAAEWGGVELRGEVGEGLPPVLADAGRLGRILDNLVGNAIRHTPQGGVVSVRARRDGNCVLVSVADTGCGIAPDRLACLFDRYYRDGAGERPELRPGGRGLGLGLAIARYLVELHGGRIWAESEPGKGSMFHFTIPCYDETAACVQRLRSELEAREAAGVDAPSRPG